MCMLSCICVIVFFVFCFFFKQKTAYEMRISDWSSDVCSSDLVELTGGVLVDGFDVVVELHDIDGDAVFFRPFIDDALATGVFPGHPAGVNGPEIGRASCRERVCQYV